MARADEARISVDSVSKEVMTEMKAKAVNWKLVRENKNLNKFFSEEKEIS